MLRFGEALGDWLSEITFYDNFPDSVLVIDMQSYCVDGGDKTSYRIALDMEGAKYLHDALSHPRNPKEVSCFVRVGGEIVQFYLNRVWRAVRPEPDIFVGVQSYSGSSIPSFSMSLTPNDTQALADYIEPLVTTIS